VKLASSGILSQSVPRTPSRIAVASSARIAGIRAIHTEDAESLASQFQLKTVHRDTILLQAMANSVPAQIKMTVGFA
jgi:hypothetical protein